MSALDDAINNLTPEDMDLLDSDPKLMADFKAKYATPTQPPVEQPKDTSMMDKVSSVGKSVLSAVSPELTSAVDIAKSPIGQKLQDLSSVPYRGLRGLAEGAATVIPALRSGDSSQLPSPQQALQKASEATQPDYKPQTTLEKTADIGAQIIEPRSLLAAKLVESAGSILNKGAKELGSQAAKLQEVLTAVDDNNFKELFNNPGKILTMPSSKETGAAFQAAKEAAGITAEDERAIATKEDFRKSVYNDVMAKVDKYLKNKPTQEQLGRKFLSPDAISPEGVDASGLGTNELAPLQSKPDVQVYSKGTMGKGTKNEMTLWGVKGDPKEISKFGYGPDPASIPEDVLKKHGLLTPEGDITPKEEPLTVADLLKAKKAGQLMAKSDPSTAGFFANEIHNKINPVLKEIAPEVYNAQQAVHLSKVKESLLNIFPQGKGMMNYFRTISMIGGSLFHGVGMLESPIVQTGLTLGARGAKEALSSPLAKIGTGAILNRAYQGLQTPFNIPEMQSLRDRLNANQ